MGKCTFIPSCLWPPHPRESNHVRMQYPLQRTNDSKTFSSLDLGVTLSSCCNELWNTLGCGGKEHLCHGRGILVEKENFVFISDVHSGQKKKSQIDSDFSWRDESMCFTHFHRQVEHSMLPVKPIYRTTLLGNKVYSLTQKNMLQ